MSNYGPEKPTGGEFSKTCPVCTTDFRTNQERQVYCSNACKRRAHNDRYYKKHQPQIVERVVLSRRRKRETYDQ